MTVVGIGGIFFRCHDPQATAEWYERVLGIDTALEGGEPVWQQEAGPTVVAPFATESHYFADDRAFMLNLRVRDLDVLVARLEAAGSVVERRPEWQTEYGRFVRTSDPDGLPSSSGRSRRRRSERCREVRGLPASSETLMIGEEVLSSRTTVVRIQEWPAGL